MTLSIPSTQATLSIPSTQATLSTLVTLSTQATLDSGDTLDVCVDVHRADGEHAHLPEVLVAQPHLLVAVVETSQGAEGVGRVGDVEETTQLFPTHHAPAPVHERDDVIGGETRPDVTCAREAGGHVPQEGVDGLGDGARARGVLGRHGGAGDVAQEPQHGENVGPVLTHELDGLTQAVAGRLSEVVAVGELAQQVAGEPVVHEARREQTQVAVERQSVAVDRKHDEHPGTAREVVPVAVRLGSERRRR